MNISFRSGRTNTVADKSRLQRTKVDKTKGQNSMIQIAVLKPSVINIKKKDVEKFKETVPERSVRGSFIPSSQAIVYPNNFLRIIGMMCIVCISPFYVGLTIFLSASASWQTLDNYYKIPLGPITGFSLINGVVPLGGMVGSMTLPYVMKYTNKRDIYFIFFGASLIFAGITCIPFVEALVIGRFLLGIICSWENSMGATLIRDLTPVQYRTLFGAFYLTSRVSGITASFLLGLLFDYQLTDPVLCTINMFPAILALVQLILLQIFIPVIPADLIAKNKLDQLRTYFLTLYSEEKVEKAVNNCVRQFKAPTKLFSYVNKNKTQEQKQEATKIFTEIQNKALFVSLHACLLRQFCGVNYLTLYTTYVLQNLNFRYYLAGPVLINIIQIAATLVGLYICYKFERRPLLLIGISGAFAATLIVSICDYFQNYAGVLGGQIIFMIFIGSMVSPIAWPYPPQLIPPLQVKYNSLISWTGSTIIAIVPVREQSYQFFFAVSVYLLACLFVTYALAMQTKGKTLREVMTGYMKKAYMQLSKIPIKPLPIEKVLPEQQLKQNKAPKQIVSSNIIEIEEKKQQKVSLLNKEKESEELDVVVVVAAAPQPVQIPKIETSGNVNNPNEAQSSPSPLKQVS